MNLEELSHYIQVKKLDIKSRKREVVYPRAYLYHILKRDTKLSLKEIGKMFNKDHATVINGLKTYNNNYRYKDFQMDILDVRCEVPEITNNYVGIFSMSILTDNIITSLRTLKLIESKMLVS